MLEKKIPFSQFKNEFLAIYPVFTLHNFKHAAQALLSTMLKSEDMFCAMTTPENASLAAVKVYLKSKKMTNRVQ